MSRFRQKAVRTIDPLTRSVLPMAAARVVIGAVVYARPALMATSLGVDAGAAERTDWVARFFGSRDLALGVGVLAGSRGCQVAACASDAGDLVAVLAALRAGHAKGPAAWATAATAGAATLLGAAALRGARG